MERFNIHARRTGLAVCTAMAAALLVGCSNHAPLASAGKPQASGESAGAQRDKAIAEAEQRVAKSPRNASARSGLAQAYLSAGRFESAATAFQDAITLGEDSPRIGLGLALSYIGSGRNAEALSVLNRWHTQIPVSDFGLALALAGQPGQAVNLLSDALRGGDDTPKTRQNLAYAYALGGRWTEARIIASQDVPADRLDARMSEWASRVRPGAFQARVASLLGAPVRPDAGQPAALALNGSADAPRMADAEPAAPQPVPAHGAELPPVVADRRTQVADSGAASAMPRTASFDAAFASAGEPAPAPVTLATPPAAAPKAESVKFVSQPTVQPLGKARSAYVSPPKHGTHLVQLGSFRTLEGAQRAWAIFQKRNPSLKDHSMRITEAEVRGQRYFRVAAEGFDRGGAHDLCSSVRQRGGGCFAYVKTRSLPGAVPGKVTAGQMLASR